MAAHKRQELLTAAIEREGEAQRQLIDGHIQAARAGFREVAGLYRQSWEAANARAFGRLVGMLKASVLAGGGAEEAEYVRSELAGADEASATANYARALAALISGDDEDAEARAGAMDAGGDAFARTGAALAALAVRNRDAYARALEAIVRDFEQRSEHLTGVAVADTAVVLQTLAGRRRLKVAIESRVVPDYDY